MEARVSARSAKHMLAERELTTADDVCCTGYGSSAGISLCIWEIYGHRQWWSWLGMQDGLHLRIRCARQLQPCRKNPLEAAESLLLIHLMRMCVLVALRARIERSCSYSVRAR